MSDRFLRPTEGTRVDKASGRRSYLHVEYDPGSGDPERPDPPLLDMTIRVFGWEPGQAEIDTRFLEGPADPFGATSAREADELLARLRARVMEEVDAAFEIFRGCFDE